MDTAKKLVSQQSAAYRELATVSSALKRAQEGTQTYKLLNDRLTALRNEITARKEQMDLLENEAAQIVKNSNLLQEEAKMRQRVSQAAAAVEDRAASKANAEAIREANKMYNQQVDLLKRINSLTLARDATLQGKQICGRIMMHGFKRQVQGMRQMNGLSSRWMNRLCKNPNLQYA